MDKNYYAIIDIGSNSMRLVVYLQEKAGRLSEVQNVKAVARLRRYLDESNILHDQGLNILIDTLQSFNEVIKTYNLKSFVCVATAAIRQAANRDDIQQLVYDKLGFPMRILSEQEEAFYGYLAVVNSTPITEGITIDIGGGSTEVTYFKNKKLVESHSFSFGALTLKDFYKNEKPTDKEIYELRKYIRHHFASLPWLKDRPIPLIAIGGSARNVVEIHQHMKEYPLAGLHQYKMQGKEMFEVSDYLKQLTLDERQKVEGLSKDRADIILPAIEVFHCLYETMGAESFVHSRKGLRDGVFYEQLSEKAGSYLFTDVLEESIQELVIDFDLNLKQIHHVQKLTKKLFDQFRGSGFIDLTKEDWELLKMASYVYNLGKYIDSESSAQHTFYLLANRTMDGLFHDDRIKLALVASFKNKTVFKQFITPYKEWFPKKEKNKLRLLGALLKLAYCLDSTNRQVVEHLDVHKKRESLELVLYCKGNGMPEQYQVEKQKKHIEKAIKQPIDVIFAGVPV